MFTVFMPPRLVNNPLILVLALATDKFANFNLSAVELTIESGIRLDIDVGITGRSAVRSGIPYPGKLASKTSGNLSAINVGSPNTSVSTPATLTI